MIAETSARAGTSCSDRPRSPWPHPRRRGGALAEIGRWMRVNGASDLRHAASLTVPVGLSAIHA